MTEDEIEDLAEQLVKKMKVSEEKAKEEQMIVGEERYVDGVGVACAMQTLCALCKGRRCPTETQDDEQRRLWNRQQRSGRLPFY